MRRFEAYALEKVEGIARLRTEWVSEPSGLEIYLRRSIAFPGVITMANITLPSHLQRQGIFSRFCAEWSPKLPLEIENVCNPYLERWLDRNGWHLYDLYGKYNYYNDLAGEIIDRRENLVDNRLHDVSDRMMETVEIDT